MMLSKALALLLSMTIVVNAASVFARNDGSTDSALQPRGQKELTDIYNMLDGTADDLSNKCKARSSWTQAFIWRLMGNNSHYNYMIAYSDHYYSFYGEEGVNWIHKHVKYNGPGWTKRYDLVAGNWGTYTRCGDGGFVNWCYNGNIIYNKTGAYPDGCYTVVFEPRSWNPDHYVRFSLSGDCQ